MGKAAVLKIGEGDFVHGFEVTLQICPDDGPPSKEIKGRLPKNSAVEGFYTLWSQAFQSLTLNSSDARRGVDGWEVDETLSTNRTTLEGVEVCRQSTLRLENCLQEWLQTADGNWSRIREKLREEFAKDAYDTRLIIQAEHDLFGKLPWQVWDLLEDYPEVGISFGLLEFEKLPANSIHRKKKRILAILGDSRNINIHADEHQLRQVKDAEVEALHQPKAREMINRLRNEKGWDIFVFSGHSKVEGEIGEIFISEEESITIEEFKISLRKAGHYGLKIAIFNSCESLGLGRQLASMNIPVVVSMQEPIPDHIAQTFLKEFLQYYTQNIPLHTALRRAKDSLEQFNEWPGITWLPVVCQNLAEVPPSWQPPLNHKQLNRGFSEDNRNPVSGESVLGEPISSEIVSYPARLIKFSTIFIVSSLVTLLIVLLRESGILQRWEFATYDWLLQIRPAEAIDDRLLIIKITDEDLQKLGPPPVQDEVILSLLQKLNSYHPRVIGLDIYRDVPQGSPTDYEKLLSYLREENNRTISVCQFNHPGAPGNAPPADISSDLLGFANLLPDVELDEKIRRHLLLTGGGITNQYACDVPLSLSFQLAYRYFLEEDIEPETVKVNGEEITKLGNVLLKPLPRQQQVGGYQKRDPGGYQLMLNYRNAGDIAHAISLGQVLDSIDPELVYDKIVLVGYTASVIEDHHPTAYGKMAGVQIHAHMVSQILSAVLEGRPLLQILPQKVEILGIWMGACWGCLIVLVKKRSLRRAAFVSVATAIFISCYFFILHGFWLPLIPTLICFAASFLAYSVLGKYFRLHLRSNE